MTKTELKAMANRIKHQRGKLLYTQEQFCEIINISASSYTKIENAFQKPSLETLIKISQKLNISLDYIVFGTENKSPIPISNSDIIINFFNDVNIDEVQHIGNFLNKIADLKKINKHK